MHDKSDCLLLHESHTVGSGGYICTLQDILLLVFLHGQSKDVEY